MQAAVGTDAVCGHGEIGIHDGFRFHCESVQVQILLPAPCKKPHLSTGQKWFLNEAHLRCMKNEAELRSRNSMKRAYRHTEENGCASLHANEVSASWRQRRRFMFAAHLCVCKCFIDKSLHFKAMNDGLDSFDL